MTNSGRRVHFSIIAIVLTAFISPAVAAPWGSIALFKKIEADASKSYRLTESNGPWMILANTFRGPDADRKAHELTIELRKQYKLEAFSFSKQFDYTSTIEGRGVNKFGGRKRMRYANSTKVREVAVLVGNFASVDEPAVEKALQKLKHARPKSMAAPGRPADKVDSAWAKMRDRMLRKNNDKKKGPMAMAFVTNNPIIPREYFAPKGLDPLVIKMNQGVKYSLLNCPGAFSVRVATFTGRSALGPAAIEKYKRNNKKNGLVDAAEKAHQMTLSLRKKGYEAYEFHDRYASLVAVGSFDRSGSPRADGKIEIDPKIHALIKTFRAEQAPVPQGAQGRAFGAHLKYTAGIPHDIQPWIVRVPKPSVAAAYARRTR